MFLLADSVLQVSTDCRFLGQLQVVQNPQMGGFQLSKTRKGFSQNVLEMVFTLMDCISLDVAEISWELQSVRILCRTVRCFLGVGILVKFKCLKQYNALKSYILEPVR